MANDEPTEAQKAAEEARRTARAEHYREEMKERAATFKDLGKDITPAADFIADLAIQIKKKCGKADVVLAHGDVGLLVIATIMVSGLRP